MNDYFDSQLNLKLKMADVILVSSEGVALSIPREDAMKSQFIKKSIEGGFAESQTNRIKLEMIDSNTLSLIKNILMDSMAPIKKLSLLDLFTLLQYLDFLSIDPKMVKSIILKQLSSEYPDVMKQTRRTTVTVNFVEPSLARRKPKSLFNDDPEESQQLQKMLLDKSIEFMSDPPRYFRIRHDESVRVTYFGIPVNSKIIEASSKYEAVYKLAEYLNQNLPHTRATTNVTSHYTSMLRMLTDELTDEIEGRGEEIPEEIVIEITGEILDRIVNNEFNNENLWLEEMDRDFI